MTTTQRASRFVIRVEQVDAFEFLSRRGPRGRCRGDGRVLGSRFANLANEAALGATRRKADAIRAVDLAAAYDKIVLHNPAILRNVI